MKYSFLDRDDIEEEAKYDIGEHSILIMELYVLAGLRIAIFNNNNNFLYFLDKDNFPQFKQTYQLLL